MASIELTNQKWDVERMERALVTLMSYKVEVGHSFAAKLLNLKIARALQYNDFAIFFQVNVCS